MHHEIWLDEWQALGIARSANSISEIFALRVYEGHPLLYYYLLYLLNTVASSTTAFIALHTLFAIASMYLLLIKINSSTLHKIFFTTSYYFIFEYTIINRNYIIAVFAILLLAYYHNRQKQNLLHLFGIITLLIHTSAYSAVFAIAYCMYIFITRMGIFTKANANCIAFSWHYIAFYAGVIANMYLFFICIQSPADNTVQLNLASGLHLSYFAQMANSYANSFFTTHAVSIYFWNNMHVFNTPLAICMCISLIVVTTLNFNSKKIKLLYVLLLLGLGFLNYATAACTYRHVGFYFLAYLFCWFIDTPTATKATFKHLVLLAFLFCQGIWGISNYIIAIQHPFSQGKAAAAYIQNSPYKNLPIVGHFEFGINTLSGYLNKPIISLHNLKPSRYCVWNNANSNYNLKDSNIVYNLNTIYNTKGAFVFNLNKQAETLWLKHYLDCLCTQNKNITQLADFTGSIYSAENVTLYYVSNTIPFAE
jgi:hypothetical protein